ncbi:hypothetical protein E3T55_16970 [Cryobacterium frigoriphilum]|uniref:Mycothiol-dependent maleylpyruvate isomerase metal-binding domain-containing protein n=1 Tax=Cryobacterium frigoriphilum TaxID=1259150 RepID=A0A4V3IQI4_9MICO|nr:hypothetical protein [Cryobacterium frigoriphilum]TFD46556.1 hypothetical protein E3T55_16970 [Cryobacterium frigoriphilum]
MKQRELFLQADAALRSVIDRLTPEQLELPAPAEWTRVKNPLLRDIIADHARDEAWVPAVLAGRTIEEVGEDFPTNLLGDEAPSDDPLGDYLIDKYDRLNDIATVAMREDLDPERIVHLSYGDYPLREYLLHVSCYRAFQSWTIARLVGLDYEMPEELVENLWEQIVPRLDDWRAMGVFGPPVEVAAGADRETELLGLTGFWTPSRATD